MVISNCWHYVCVCVCVYSVTYVYPTLWDPMDFSPQAPVHGISQVRILDGVIISSSRGSSQPRNWSCISCVLYIVRQILFHWATWEVQLVRLGYFKEKTMATHSSTLAWRIPWTEEHGRLQSMGSVRFLQALSSSSTVKYKELSKTES